VVTFTDTSGDLTSLSLGAVRSYDFYLNAMSKIKDLQRYVMNRGNRNPQADYLVRAPVPAFVAVSLAIGYQGLGELPDAAPIKTAVAERVNALNFQLGRLPASIIYDAVHDVISRTEAYVMSPVDILVRIRQPNGTYVQIRSGDQIEIPDDPANEVSQRTVIFYLDADDVDVLVERVPSIKV
jgi:predicted DNA-binding protein